MSRSIEAQRQGVGAPATSTSTWSPRHAGCAIRASSAARVGCGASGTRSSSRRHRASRASRPGAAARRLDRIQAARAASDHASRLRRAPRAWRTMTLIAGDDAVHLAGDPVHAPRRRRPSLLDAFAFEERRAFLEHGLCGPAAPDAPGRPATGRRRGPTAERGRSALRPTLARDGQPDQPMTATAAVGHRAARVRPAEYVATMTAGREGDLERRATRSGRARAPGTPGGGPPAEPAAPGQRDREDEGSDGTSGRPAERAGRVGSRPDRVRARARSRPGRARSRRSRGARRRGSGVAAPAATA